MKKLILTAVAACVSMAVTAAYADTTAKQDTIRLAQADKDKPAKRTTVKEPGSVSDATTTPGPSGTKGRTPSGKERKSGPETKGVSDAATTTEGPSGQKGRTPSGKQRKAGPDAKSVDDATPSGSAKKAEKK